MQSQLDPFGPVHDFVNWCQTSASSTQGDVVLWAPASANTNTTFDHFDPNSRIFSSQAASLGGGADVELCREIGGDNVAQPIDPAAFGTAVTNVARTISKSKHDNTSVVG